jgi:hypothetical protein
MNKVYPSKVDTWLGNVLRTVPVLLVFVVWELIQAPVPGRWFIALAILSIGICLPLSLLFLTRYTLSETHLSIRSGFFTWSIPLNDISAIEPTRDPRSSPALSMDRLRIQYGRAKSVMISPANREEFLSALKTLNVPHA